MRKIVWSQYISLDGVVEEPGEWSIPYFSDDLAQYKNDELHDSDALLLGRTTYEGFAAAWPEMEEVEGDFAVRMNTLPKYVASTTLEKADWNNSTIIRENIPDEVVKLKREPGQTILIGGSGTLAKSLMQHNLIDEIRMLVHPIAVGAGKRLFQGMTKPIGLKLVDTRAFDAGVVALTYQGGVMTPARLNTTEVASKDGTKIAFDVSGDGPPLILIAGALSDRASHTRLVELLAPELTVYNYDRRGRGASGDAAPYAVEREIEDLDAIIDTAGEPVLLYGSSSGGNLALQAALRRLKITGLALWEPNFIVDRSRPPLPADYVEHLHELVSAGRRGEAVEYFMTAAVGMPAGFVAPRRDAPFWSAQESLAHTLAYDGAVVGDGMSGNPLTADPWASVAVPTLILDGGTVPWMSATADALADVLPNAERRTLAGQTHDVAPGPVAEAITDFFGRGGRR